MREEKRTFSVAEVAKLVGGELVGDGERRIGAIRPFESATAADLAFLDPKNIKLVAAIDQCKAGGLITGKSLAPPPGMSAIRIDPPHLGLGRALAILYPQRREMVGVSPAAHVSSGVTVGRDVNIYPGASIGRNATIGDRTDIRPGASIGSDCSIGADCVIYPHVTIYDGCTVGNRVIIHAGAVIGADGFGFAPEPVADDPREPIRQAKIPQVGSVVIEDDVEIGANTTIDRATLSETVIGRGTKIDNLVMVAHNCRIGRHSIIVSQVGISGSAELGNYVTVAGQAGLVGHIKVGDRAVIAAQAGVTKDVPAGKTVVGSPAMDFREGLLAYSLIERLPEMKKRLLELLRRVEKLEAGTAEVEDKTPR